MNFKLLSTNLLLVFGLFTFIACEKENVDVTKNQEGEVTTEVVDCNNMQMSIGHDGNGNLSPGLGGGTAPYSYLWSTGETTENISVVVGGTYSLTVNDSLGCTVFDETIISLPGACDSISLVISGDAAGRLTATISNGTAPYSYLWSTGETTDIIDPIPAGTFSLTVTDALGCVAVAEITACGSFEAYIDELPAGSGILSLSHNGGTAPYAYLWSTGETTKDITVTADGTYSVTIDEANGCVETALINISVVPCQGFSVIIAEQPPGSNDLYTSLSGGSAPYLYLWSTGETTPNISVSGSGTYSVTVEDSNGCTALGDIQI